MTTPLFPFTQPVPVAVAANRTVTVHLTDAAPLWVAEGPEYAVGTIELVVLDGAGAEVARMATGTPGNGYSFDLSALDPDAVLRFELRAGDVCVLPPVQLSIGALRAQALAGEPPGDHDFAPPSIVRTPSP